MRVAIINNFYPPAGRGGAEKIAQQMVDDFLSQGHEVIVITTAPYAQNDYFKNLKIIRWRPRNIYYLSEANKHSLPVRFIWNIIDTFNILAYWQLKHILKQEQPDLVIAHNLKGLGYLTPSLLSALQIKYIQYIHDVQLSIPSGILLTGQEKFWGHNNILQKIYEIVCRQLFRYPQEVISPSQWLMDFYTQKGFFKKSKKTIKSFVWEDYDLPAITAKLKIFKDKIATKQVINFLYVGQIEEHKGILWLAENWQNLSKNYELTIVGGGTKEPELKNIIASEPRLYFQGWQERERLKKFYQSADILIMPTLCYENRPEVILEAYQHNLPVLASNLGGIPEIIKVGITGGLFTAGNVNFLKHL